MNLIADCGPFIFPFSIPFVSHIDKMNTSRLMFRKSPGYFGRIQAFRFATSSTAEKPEGDQKKKRLDVAIVGAPNAGKSQLINVLTQSKIAAVSRKRHTTRSDVLGARTVDNTTQIVFKDTPGFLRLEDAKEERLDRDLIVTAATELQHVDYSLLVVDAARKLTESYRHALVQLMVGALNSRGRMEEVDFEDKEESTSKKNEEYSMQEETSKFAIILNKVDLVNPKKKLLDMAMEIGELADACLIDQYSDKDGSRNLDFDKLLKISPLVFYVSALEEEGVDEILDHLVSNATPCRSWAVESGQSTNMTKYEHAQELIREKIYRCLHQEREYIF
jgi:GTP-binding protein Era